jgi:hypothetical protein
MSVRLAGLLPSTTVFKSWQEKRLDPFLYE